ncbi:MAG TPA: hypothetical protein VMB71_13920 [Acetobacteraceae bacterium]|nr:hypothetical protein [Acetobacteraceae bacterium]
MDVAVGQGFAAGDKRKVPLAQRRRRPLEETAGESKGSELAGERDSSFSEEKEAKRLLLRR